VVGRGAGLLLAALGLAACTDEVGATGTTVSVRIRVPPATPLETLDVQTVRIAVSGPDLVDDRIATFPFEAGGGSIDGVPDGLERTVTVEALDGDGTVRARGRSLSIDVGSAGSYTVDVLVAPVERFTEAFHYDELGVPAALTAGRVGHTVTPLRDGRVLVAGGARLRMVSGGDQTPVPGIDTFLGTLEVYDPRTGEVEVLEQQLVPGRAFHTATRLRGRQGYVLLAGGMAFINGKLMTIPISDVFDPGRDETFPTMDLHFDRARHAATLRPDGSVLVSGGVVINGGSPTDYDRVDGIVGVSVSAELFRISDPEPERHGCNKEQWTFCEQGRLSVRRADHGSVRVGDAVLVFGGRNLDGPVAETELFSLEDGDDAGRFATYPDLALDRPRYGAAVVRRSDESVVVIGGAGVREDDTPEPLNSLEVFSYSERGVHELVTVSATTGVGRSDPAAVLLEDDSILVAGGRGGPQGAPLSDAWLFPWVEGGVEAGRSVRDLLHARAGARAVRMDTGAVLVAGGEGASDGVTPSFPDVLEVYTP